jgi:hypothetical protein
LKASACAAPDIGSLSEKAGTEIQPVTQVTQRHQQSGAAKYFDLFERTAFMRSRMKRVRENLGNSGHFAILQYSRAVDLCSPGVKRFDEGGDLFGLKWRF